MTERGALFRRGTVTNGLTSIGTFASSTGLPPESTTTSIINERVGAFDGHDSLSGMTGIRSYPFGFASGSLASIGYMSPSAIISINNNSITFQPANSPNTNNTPGTTLPVPATVTTYYKMTGYYTTGAVYESFVVTGSPTSASTTNPNTGHALINTYVAQTWTS